MKHVTIMVIPPGSKNTWQFTMPGWLFTSAKYVAMLSAVAIGYYVFDYVELRAIRKSYRTIVAENNGLRGEAKSLMNSLGDAKKSLEKVREFTNKLTEITQHKVKDLSKTTGIGPLSVEEYKIASRSRFMTSEPQNYTPLGINPERLFFRPVFEELYSLNESSNRQAIDLQIILSNLSKQQNMLASIPTVSPVNGWVTSGFGVRVSPFTGKRMVHKGLDVAAPVGTPIYSPADGVVIFTGTKTGFGNFIMIAHGYGIVSRFGHNNQNLVQPGQRVQRGEQIATVGDSGRTTGPHLHYEVVVNGSYSDPQKFILSLSDEDIAYSH